MEPDSSITLEARVKKVIPHPVTNVPDRAQICFIGADYLYDEIRIPNIHKWKVGKDIEVVIRPSQRESMPAKLRVSTANNDL